MHFDIIYTSDDDAFLDILVKITLVFMLYYVPKTQGIVENM